MTTHKEALKQAALAYDKEHWNMDEPKEISETGGAMEAAIQAYLDERGLVMVPYDPTTAMMSAVHYTKGEFVDVYHAMLAAAPDPFK
ncbi:hypothetical protein [Microcystis phage Mwe-JY13]